MKKTLIIAPSAVDLAVHVDHLPKSDEEINPIRTSMRIGGAGWCAACVFQMLNLPYELISPVGTGVYGDEVRKAAKARGIKLQNDSEEVGGCAYTLIDAEGNRGLLAVPGAENTFEKTSLNGIDPEEIGAVLVSGTMFTSEHAEELLEALKPYQGKLFLELDARGAGLDPELLKQIYALKPILYLAEDEVMALLEDTRQQDLLEAVRALTKQTDAPACVLMNDGDALYVTGRQGMSTAGAIHQVADSSGVEETHAAAFLAARTAGLYPRTALAYAAQFAAGVAETEEMALPDSEGEIQRQRLADAILEKKS